MQWLVALVIFLGPPMAGLAIAIALARKRESLWSGMAVGLPIGLVVMFVLSFSLAFAGYVLPVGQVEFWLTNLLVQLFPQIAK
ncbi:MAG TPA: hypothetical protein VIU14_02045 [Mesorhizobium sp.]